MALRAYNIFTGFFDACVTWWTTSAQVFVSFFVAIAAVACSSYESDVSTGQSHFDITLSLDSQFTDASGNRIDVVGADAPSVSSARLTIESMATGVSHTWSVFTEYDSRESFQAGDYNISAVVDMGEGLELGAETNVTTFSGSRMPVNLVLTPCQALVNITVSGASSNFSVVGTGLHVLEHGLYIDGSRIFCTPKPCKVYARIRDNANHEVIAVFDRPFATERARSYDVVVDVKDDCLVASVDGAVYSTLDVDRTFLVTTAPSITSIGFESSTAVSATEGFTLTEPIAMDITSSKTIAHLYLSIDSPIIDVVGHDDSETEVDIMNLTPEQAEAFAKASITCEIGKDNRTCLLTFTKMIEELASLTSARSIFTVTAVDILGRMSEPMHLTVDTRTMAFDVLSVSPLVVGENKCTVTLKPTIAGVEESDMRFYTIRDGVSVDCNILDSKANADGTFDVTISIPNPRQDTVVFFDYLGLNRAKFTVSSVMPQFYVTPDAHATYVRFAIKAENDEATKILTSKLLFYNDDQRCSVLERDIANGIIIVNGLSPDTRYRISPCITVGQPLGTVTFTTEKALDVPDGDFEDAKPSMIKYSNLPCGGRYAVTPFDIANRQNYIDIDIPWSNKYWASINEKTFCINATHKNTWYIQPSTAIVYDPKSGSKAMRITSVGWDLDGEAIADYIPTSATPVPTYSLVVPKVKHRSAGRLFLGNYSFRASDMSEMYDTGVPFTSRPTALNGFYKYTADQTFTTDHGAVHVRLVARNGADITVVAEGYTEFSAVPDYTAFNVPLEYVTNDVRPTHLEIMFVSSTLAMDDAISDDAVPVTSFADHSAMIGSTLWVDNLSFAY